MTDDQILHRLLEQLRLLQEEQSTMRLVLRAAVETHPDRLALRSRLEHHMRGREESDLAHPVDPEARRAAVEKWRKWIERGAL